MSLYKLQRRKVYWILLGLTSFRNHCYGCNSLNIFVFCKSKAKTNFSTKRVLRRCSSKLYWSVAFIESCAQWYDARKLVKVNGNYAKDKRNWKK